MSKKNYRYDLAGRFWNVNKWEVWYARVDSQKGLIGILHTMIKELRPYQISITDHNQESGDAEDPTPKYKQMGISFVEETNNE
jgi:hypothetical protein